MIKSIIALLLSICCLILLKINIDTLNSSSSFELIQNIESQDYQKKEQVRPLIKKFNPKVRSKLFDLNDGYLFNAERYFVVDTAPVAQSDTESDQVNINDIVYDGSLIMAEIRTALISYPEKKSGNMRGGGRAKSII